MLTRMLVLTLGTGLPAYAGWSIGRPYGLLIAFLSGNLAFALGWYYSRKFVREHLDI